MKRAMEEAQRRRAVQEAYNKKHHITPKSIQKAITEIIEGARVYEKEWFVNQAQAVTEEKAEYLSISQKQLAKHLRKLEEQMYRHAKNLEFEEAAIVRDKIQQIRNGLLEVKQ